MGISQEKLESLKKEHGRLRHVKGAPGPDCLHPETGEQLPEWEAIVVTPKSPDVKFYKSMLHDPAQRSDAQETLFKKICVSAWTVWDGECDVLQLLKRFPMSPEGCSDEIGELTGLKTQEHSK